MATTTLVTSSGGTDIGSPKARPFLFLVIDSQEPAGSAARFSLDGMKRVVIGRGDRRFDHVGEELSIHLADGFVSTLHAVLERGPGGRWVLVDHSRNGTYVNGARVTAATLDDGDVIEVGHAFFIIQTKLLSSGVEPAVVRAADLRPRADGLASLVPDVERAFHTLEVIAQSSVTVLLQGETGTGKEVFARALHALSRRVGDFVAVNCAAIPEALLESELFGYRKGAFSGATEDRPGLIRAAHKGTLFLDEVGDLPLPSQAALLRVLQEREVLPVGATKPVAVDLRVVAASHHNLAELVTQKRFRSDLEGRLSGLEVTTVPLRHRREDLGLLVTAILRRAFPAFADDLTFHRAAVRALLQHAWPKNIRELEHALVAATVLTGGKHVIRAGHLPKAVQNTASPSAQTPPRDEVQAELETHLAAEKGNVSAVARRLGKSRRQIQRYLRRYSLDPVAFRAK